MQINELFIIIILKYRGAGVMKSNNRNILRDNRGFAISGILYPILIIIVFLIVELLSMLASRKAVLDQIRREVRDEIYKKNGITVSKD